MLQNTLLNIPHIVLLRSDKVFEKLITLLIDSSKNEGSFDQLFEGVRDFYPNQYRLDEIELSLSQNIIQQSGIGSDFNFTQFTGVNYNFSFLGKLFEHFFTTNGARIFAKEENLESYLSFITKVSPLQIMGNKLANELKDKKIELSDLFSFSNAYTPLGLEVEHIKKYAENHLHLKGAGYHSFNFAKLISYPTPKNFYKKSFLKKIPRINEFSYINNYTFSIGQIVDILKLSTNFIYGSLMTGSVKEHSHSEKLYQILSFKRSVGYKYDHSINNIADMAKLFPIFKNKPEDLIIQEIVRLYNKEEFSKASLLENTLFFYIFEKTNSNYLKMVIKVYLHTNNILRSYMVMSQNLGLAHFSEYSGSYLRSVERKSAKNTAKSIIGSGTNYLNAKLDVKQDADSIMNIIEDFKDAFDQPQSKLKYNFGLSSKKNREDYCINIQTGDLLPRFYNKRKAVRKESLALDDFMRNVKYKQKDSFSYALKYMGIKAYKQKKKFKGKTFDISNYVVSMDAVGKETHTPPEVFAPYFRYLRNAPKNLKNNIFSDTKSFKHHSKLLITVHAGEDFNHIITGMRRVDETINFFEMQRRDRLGHVLSIGMFPKDWLDGIKDVLMYKGDYFDDLVWLCHKLKWINIKGLNISGLIKIYEDKVWGLFKELYPMYSGTSLHIHNLYEAWEYRKNCVLTYYQRKRKELLFDPYAQSVLDDTEPDKCVEELFELYQTNKKVRDNYQEIIKIDKKSISKEELKIWEALQDYMINEIAQKGIVIETNPSSNVFISSMKGYLYHPIFRFYPPKEKYLKKGKKFNKYNQRNGRASITINSDDPAIFVTTLQNEYRTIKNIAKEQYKCSDKEADDWINDIRKFGIHLFKESYNGRG